MKSKPDSNNRLAYFDYFANRPPYAKKTCVLHKKWECLYLIEQTLKPTLKLTWDFRMFILLHVD